MDGKRKRLFPPEKTRAVAPREDTTTQSAHMARPKKRKTKRQEMSESLTETRTAAHCVATDG